MAQKKKKQTKESPVQIRYKTQAWTYIFAAISLLAAVALTWADHKLKGVSGIDLIFNRSDVAPAVLKAFPSAIAVATVLLLGILITTLVGLIYSKLDWVTKNTRIVPWIQTLLAGYSAVTLMLYTSSAKVKGVQFAIGYYWSTVTLIGLALHGIYMAVANDEERGYSSNSTALIAPVCFGIVLIGFLLFHFQYVNFDIIPPAPKALRQR